jgi:alkanesulfonate monooxygenase SsuD/methylene tetrahydromethanopterin reductase-like flavin-dependent oxidoreductase (luciferase family)
MDLGYFMIPSHPPERNPYDWHQYDLQALRWGDELGVSEAWVGEHFTVAWEPNPAPDLTIAQALLQTKRIKLAPGAHLLPYHHPVELAHRVAFLDHLAQGRLQLGVAAGDHLGDFMAFGVDGQKGENHAMMREALEIMLGIWAAEGEFEYSGQYWTVHIPPEMIEGNYRHHMHTFTKPHPPIGMTVLAPESDAIKLAGSRGYMPLSIHLNTAYTLGHWQAYADAAEAAGLKPDRRKWRLYTEILVADTDAEAERLALKGPLGSACREYVYQFCKAFGFLKHLKHDPLMPDEEVTPEYFMRTSWIIGSVATVSDRIVEMYETTGGFGTLLWNPTDWGGQAERMRHTLDLLVKDVMPRVNRRVKPLPVVA